MSSVTSKKMWREGRGNERDLKTHGYGGNASLGGVVPGKIIDPRFLVLQA